MKLICFLPCLYFGAGAYLQIVKLPKIGFSVPGVHLISILRQ